MGVSWTRELTEQLAWYWTTLFRPRLAGLTDEEYLWEPVTGCWTIRPTLARPCGPAEGPFRDLPMATLVLHINREVFHHAAEVALLRDLYRARWT
jgi:hypothetical protein